MTRLSIGFAALCTAAVIAIVLGVRWFGPHDLYEKDQPKTLAYTADIVRNGRFALPRDVIYQPATKPPMYNWVGAAVIAPTGLWTEWTLKFPSVLGVLGTGAIVAVMARRATPARTAAAAIVPLLAVGVWFTFGSAVRHGSVLRLSYLARPDMLLCAFVTAAWALFTVAVERPTPRRAAAPAIGAWICVTAAALTKGPAALLPIAFALTYPLLNARAHRSALRHASSTPRYTPLHEITGDAGHDDVDRRHRPLLEAYVRLWAPVGVPIVALGVGLWFMLAYVQEPVHVRDVIWGAEVFKRIKDETPEGATSPFYSSAMWFVTKAQPWGAIAAGGLIACVLVPRLRRTGGAAALFLAIVLIGLSLPAGKRQDYLLPAYPPAAVLIAVLVADLVRHRVVGFAGIVGVVGVGIYEGVALVQRSSGWRPARVDWRGVDWNLLAVLGVVTVAALVVERRRRVPLALLAVVPLLLAIQLGRQQMRRSLEATGHWSDRAVTFVEQVRRRVRDDQRLLVLVRGKHPLTTLLGRHPGSYLTPRDLAAADYVILPAQADLPAELVSAPLPMGFAQIEDRPLSVLGLYRKVPLERLIAIQKEVATWTEVENPYHTPGTVYRED